jgi:hypothetical protein
LLSHIKHPGQNISATEADQAMKWHQQAIAAGCKNVAQLKQDPDLNILRDRDDFRELLAKLQEKEPTPEP